MNFWLVKTKVFAFIFLFFVNLIIANAQNDSSIYQLPAGTVMSVQMDNEINSEVSSEEDTFTVTLAQPVVRRETIVLPAGTILEGRITKVKRAAVGGKSGDLEIIFQTLRLVGGKSRSIEGVLVNDLKTESKASVNALTIVGTTALGGIIGAVSKVKNGALIGTGIGAGAGSSIAYLSKGRNVRIKADETFEIKLTKDVNLPVQDF